MGRKKKQSEKQIAANRKNAQKSTGPRTDAGKSRSRRNAVKHGMTAEKLIESFVVLGEDSDQYRDVRKSLEERYGHLGAATIPLFDVIAVSTVRLHCAWRAEVAAIESERKSKREEFENRQRARVAIFGDKASSSKVREMLHTVWGTKKILEAVKPLLIRLWGRALPSALAVRSFERIMEKAIGGFAQKVVKCYNTASKLKQSLESEYDYGKAFDLNEILIELLNEIEEFRIVLCERLDELEKDADKSQELIRRQASLPSAEVCEKIRRYDTAAWNKLEKAWKLLLQLEDRMAL